MLSAFQISPQVLKLTGPCVATWRPNMSPNFTQNTDLHMFVLREQGAGTANSVPSQLHKQS